MHNFMYNNLPTKLKGKIISILQDLNLSKALVILRVSFSHRFLKQHPEHKALHKDLVKFGDDDDKMYDSPAFENSAMSVFNTFDMAIDKMDKNVDETISSLQRAGRMHVKLKNFDTAYFKVSSKIMVYRQHFRREMIIAERVILILSLNLT